MTVATFSIHADCSELDAFMRELSALVEPLDDLPEELVGSLRGLVSNLGDEILLAERVPAGAAGKQVVRFGVKPGGRLELCLAALRAFRVDVPNGFSGNRHGGLRDEG